MENTHVTASLLHQSENNGVSVNFFRLLLLASMKDDEIFLQVGFYLLVEACGARFRLIRVG